MTEDQEFAELCDEFPDWHLWRGRDAHGQPAGWHATRQHAGGSTILAADGPAELRRHLLQVAVTAQVGGAR